MAMFFFRVGLKAPLVISPTCSENQSKLMISKVWLSAHCSEVLYQKLCLLCPNKRQVHERYSPLWMLPTLLWPVFRVVYAWLLWLVALFVLFEK